MRKWYHTKTAMGGYPSEIGDEVAFVELDEAQAEIDELVDMLEKVLTDSVTGVVPQSHLDKIEKVIAKHKEKE